MTSHFVLPQKTDSYLELLCKIFQEEEKTALQEIIVNSEYEVEEGREHDNWNGGIDGHLLTLMLPISLYLKYRKEIASLGQEILSELRSIADTETEYFCGINITSSENKERDPNWRENSGLLQKQRGQKRIGEKEQRRIWDSAPPSYRVFLSHKTEDKIQTARLKNYLQHFGIHCFVAHEDIQPTTRWATEIENSLFSADCCVALMTDKYHDSLWTDHEIGCAYGRGIPVIPVKLGAKAPYGLIGQMQALVATWDNVAEKLLPFLFRDGKILDAYIESVENCPNWNHSTILSKAFPHIKNINSQQIDRLLKAWQTNHELKTSYAFNGTKPSSYGPGLGYYMAQWAPTRFKDAEDALKVAVELYSEEDEHAEDIPF